MGVDEFVLGTPVGAVLHDVAEAVEGEEDGRAVGRGDFFPESLEDGPGDFGVAGSELGEPGEGGVGLEGDREGVLVGELESGEETVVGFGDLAQPGCCIGVLGVECWCCARDWGVGRVSIG